MSYYHYCCGLSGLACGGALYNGVYKLLGRVVVVEPILGNYLSLIVAKQGVDNLGCLLGSGGIGCYDYVGKDLFLTQNNGCRFGLKGSASG